jgi:hypothetical protein
MAELLKAVLSETSNSQQCKVYTVETGFVTSASINNITQDLYVNLQSDTLFLCQSFGVTLGYLVGAGSNQFRAKMPMVTPVFATITDTATRQKFFSGSAGSQTTIPASCYNPSINDRTDVNQYYMFADSGQIQVSLNANLTGLGATTVNIGIAFYGVEYRFNSMPSTAQLKALALTYNPPAKDQARAMSLDPLLGVMGKTGTATISANPSQTRARIAAIQAELNKVTAGPQNIQTANYARYLTGQITQLKASIQAANATVNSTS